MNEVLDDKELFDRLEKSGLAEKLDNDPAWKLIKEAGDRIVAAAADEFANNVKADDVVRIIELQVIMKKFKWIFSEIDMMIQEGHLVFEECKERGLVEKLLNK